MVSERQKYFQNFIHWPLNTLLSLQVFVSRLLWQVLSGKKWNKTKQNKPPSTQKQKEWKNVWNTTVNGWILKNYVLIEVSDTSHRSLVVDKWNSWDNSSVMVTSGSINHCLTLLSCIKLKVNVYVIPKLSPNHLCHNLNQFLSHKLSTTHGPGMKQK